MIKFTVNRTPEEQKRHRRGLGKSHYDPSFAGKTAFLAMAFEHRPDKPIDFAIHVELLFIMPRPQTKYHAAAHHIDDPDIDNLIKFVFDALNGIFWKDDKYIAKLSASKMYGEEPRTVIEIEEL